MTREAEAAPPAERGRSVLVNSAASMGSSLVAWIVQAAIVVAAVRTFGVAEWGHYATTTSLIAIFIALSQAGIGTVVLRELSSPREDHNAWLGSALLAVVATSAIAMACLVPVGLALGYEHEIIVLLAIGTASILLISVTEVLRPAFTSRHLMIFGAAFDLTGLAVFAIAATAVLVLGGGPYELLAVSVLGSAVTALCAVVLLRRTGLRPRLSLDSGRVMRVVRVAIPLAGITFVNTIYDRLDVVLLSKLGSATEVAHYSVTYTLTKFTWLVPTVLVAAIYPIFARQLEEDRDRARATMFTTLRALLLVGLPAALFLSLAGHDFLPWFFGPGYSESGDLLAVMAWNTVAIYVNYVTWYAMVGLGLEREALWALAASLALNAGLNVILIPIHGAMGAAVALVAAELLLCVIQLWIIHRRLGGIPLLRLAAAPVAVAAIAVPLGRVVSDQVTPLAGGIVGAATLLLGLVLARYVTLAELSPLSASLGRRYERNR